MWRLTCLVLFTPAIVKGLSDIETNLVVDYFNYRNVKVICLLQNEESWFHKIAKQATKQNFVVSAVKINNGSNIDVKLSKCLQQNFLSVGVLISTESEKFEQVMRYASRKSFLDESHKWLILHNDISKNITKSDPKYLREEENRYPFLVLNELNISVDADIVMAIKPAPKEYQLYEIINYGKMQGGHCIIKKSGRWELNKNGKSSKFTTNLNEYKYYRRWNFHGLPIRTMSVVSPVPENFDSKALFDVRPSPGVATITRTSFIMLEVIFEVHNLRFVHSLAERWIGDISLNQSKKLVSSGLYNKQQDLTPLLRLLIDTINDYDVLHPPTTYIETKYYYRIPTYGPGKYENQFLRPLSKGTWICVLFMMVLCVAILVVSARLERRPSAGQYAIFSVLAFFCQQFFNDVNTETRVSSARKLTVFVTGLSCVIIYNYYTSSVVSWLLNGPPPPINSLQELLESPLDLIYENVGYTRSWLLNQDYYFNKRNAKIEDEIKKRKVFNRKQNAPLLVTLEEGIKMVKAGGYAFHTDVDSANSLISKNFDQNELCELGSLKSMEKAFLYASVQKNSPFIEFFNWSLLRLYERGIRRCIQLRTWSKPVLCQGSSPRALALGGAAPAFLLLAGGYLLATGIMVVERIVWKYKQNCKDKNKIGIKREAQLKIYDYE